MRGVNFLFEHLIREIFIPKSRSMMNGWMDEWIPETADLNLLDNTSGVRIFV